MDEPIIYPRYKVSRDGSNLYLRLFVALANDEKDEFMRLIKDPGFEEVRDSFTANKIFSEDALEIAITVFNGKTKGLIDIEDVLKDGMTPLHLAVIHRAPRLTKYLLQRGDKVDAICDHKKLNLEHATPIDLSICNIAPGYSRTLFDILWWVCFHNRDQMEIIRMLVRSKQNTTWSSHTLFNYAYKGELHKLAALFLAVPELFLSSQESGELSLLSKLDLKLNSLENKTDNEKLLSLLLDVFALVGVKLATYIRLEEFAVKSRTKKEIDQTHLEIDFFLREVARKKLGVLSPDYYLRFVY
ncbi:uncharacterized protein LOC141638450 [Silene latifolia]|uniref:uncharacterized protein LOC141638450 n=1 Tax=Silene latifolia TaxID=37657 RepID=UPI003D77DFAA